MNSQAIFEGEQASKPDTRSFLLTRFALPGAASNAMPPSCGAAM